MKGLVFNLCFSHILYNEGVSAPHEGVNSPTRARAGSKLHLDSNHKKKSTKSVCGASGGSDSQC